MVLVFVVSQPIVTLFMSGLHTVHFTSENVAFLVSRAIYAAYTSEN